MVLETAIEILLNGLQQGAIFALLGIGLSVILGTMDFLNLAHGALYLIGGYAGMYFIRETSLSAGYLNSIGVDAIGLGLGFAAAMILVPVFGFIVGLLMERYVAEPFYDRPETDQLLVTFGLALIVQEVIKGMLGGNTFQPTAPTTLFGINVGGPVMLPIIGNYPQWRLYLVGIALFVIGLTYLVIEKTDFGLVVQAGTHDSEMVRMLGIRINRSYSLVFAMGAALAAFAGLIGVSFQTVSPQIGTERALIPAFLVLVVGGAGSVIGAIFGGFVLGITVAGMTVLASQWAQIVLYAVAAGVLLFRPEGLFGSKGVVE
ncbi:branched-chain amino acid ABC transporter permease [Haloglomus irregulare]|jgi:branched-chain amino acid transport system permease protein|uniref:Branched-chain amino acid ABC transporter permease n=1 Tax=Haloglomus irregulare TaxID=2234134 RepID=A0A554N9Z3_9EURY|nr:branched-chain amino acid ABC transporter permease [Haloglomus irregulare]TSD14224.1 branched-chain amino acid ABC transporter permease [Haloglomus irregulare]